MNTVVDPGRFSSSWETNAQWATCIGFTVPYLYHYSAQRVSPLRYRLGFDTTPKSVTGCTHIQMLQPGPRPVQASHLILIPVES